MIVDTLIIQLQEKKYAQDIKQQLFIESYYQA